MATTLILKNNTGAILPLPGTGMQLPAGGQDNYTGILTAILKIASSPGVRALVTAGTVVVNDGTIDLPVLDAIGMLDALWSSSAQQGIGLLPRGYISGARLSWLSNQAVSAGEVGKVSTVADSNGNFPLVWSGVLNADMAVAGPGGLQTGQVEAADTWYELLVIGASNGSQPIALLLVPVGVAFNQANYDIYRRIGFVRNNALFNILPFIQVGDGNVRTISYDLNGISLALVFFGNATAFTDVDCSSLVPPKGRTKITLSLFFGNAAGAFGDVVRIRPKGATATVPPFGMGPGQVLAGFMLGNLDAFTGPNQMIQYMVTDANDQVIIGMVSYEDEL
jgi:hypothetical protein